MAEGRLPSTWKNSKPSTYTTFFSIFPIVSLKAATQSGWTGQRLTHTDPKFSNWYFSNPSSVLLIHSNLVHTNPVEHRLGVHYPSKLQPQFHCSFSAFFHLTKPEYSHSSIGMQTIAKAVGDWYYDRSPFQKIDCAYPCDSTCHNRVFDPHEHPELQTEPIQNYRYS